MLKLNRNSFYMREGDYFRCVYEADVKNNRMVLVSSIFGAPIGFEVCERLDPLPDNFIRCVEFPNKGVGPRIFKEVSESENLHSLLTKARRMELNLILSSVPKSRCHRCGYVLAVAELADQIEAVPEENDISHCMKCGAIGIYTKELKVRPFTCDELVHVMNNPHVTERIKKLEMTRMFMKIKKPEVAH